MGTSGLADNVTDWELVHKLYHIYLYLVVTSIYVFCALGLCFRVLLLKILHRTPDSEVRGPGFDTRSGNILSFLLPLFQEGQLSVTGESMCKKYWLTA